MGSRLLWLIGFRVDRDCALLIKANLLGKYQLSEEARRFHRLVGSGGFGQRKRPVDRRPNRAPVQHLHNLPHVLFGPHEHAVDLFLLAE